MIPTKDECNRLLLQLKNGDEMAFKSIFNAFYNALCIYSIQFTESLQQSEDIVQEVFVDIWVKKLYRNIENLRFYLFASVRNRSVAVACKNGRSVSFYSLDDVTESYDIGDYTEEELEEKRKRLQASLEVLSPKEYAVINEIIINSKPYKLVAAEMGVSVNTVKTHFSRAMKRLRKDGTLILIPFI